MSSAWESTWTITERRWTSGSRHSSSRRFRRILVGIGIFLLLPWLFAQEMPSAQHLRQYDDSEDQQAVGTVLSGSLEHLAAYWWPDILTATKKTDVPPVLIAAVMLHESGGQPDAAADPTDPLAGAYGLMQLEPGTAAALPGYYSGARQNPQENLILGAELLKMDAQIFGGNWLLGLAAYYGGPSFVKAYGITGNVPWSTASQLLNVVPCQAGPNYFACVKANDDITMTVYVNTIQADMRIVAGWQQVLALPKQMPSLFPVGLILPAGIVAGSLMGEVIEIAEIAGAIVAA